MKTHVRVLEDAGASSSCFREVTPPERGGMLSSRIMGGMDRTYAVLERLLAGIF